MLDTAPRVAGIDVHKMSLTCTVLVEDDNGQVESETRQYRTYGAELGQLVDWLSGLKLARVVMESTGVYWKAVQRALFDAGVQVWICNAHHVKRVPGRKTDVSDSQWLATLARHGLVNPSFVAPPRLEDLRRLTRLYARTRRLASTLRNMLHRMLDEGGLRIGGILTDLFGLSGRNLLDGLVEGRDPEHMVQGVKGKARKKIPALLDALGQGLDDGAKPLVVLLRDVLDAVERSLADLERRIFDAVKRDYELPWTLLQTLPGAGPLAAAALLAEVGDDMETFSTARRLASWAGMCPGNNESAGKSKVRAGSGARETCICGGSCVRLPNRRRARATCSSGLTSGDSRSGAARDGRSWRRRTRSCASCSRCSATASRTAIRRSTTRCARRSRTRRAG